MQTRAKKVFRGYSLAGSKTWISNRADRRSLLVWAKTEDGRIRGFLAEKGAKGTLAPAIHGKVGLRHLDHRRSRDGRGVRSGREPASGRRRPQGPVHLPERRALRNRLGRARRCRGLLAPRARQYVLDRKQFGRPLAANQLIQKKLADMQTEICLGLQGVLRFGRMKDEWHPTRPRSPRS